MAGEGGLFVIKEDGTLAGLSETKYDSERILQELLAKHPALLAGELVDPESPRRWLLIKREMGVPGEERGSDRWSLDHLFVDQEGIPTLVEVKRHSDSRIRREVVGQMLDYAANSVVYWPVERVRSDFEARCEREGREPHAELRAFLGSDSSADEFWMRVRTNLQAGRIRLLFVADEIPAELRRVVEFLNTQMNVAEVLAVEVRQYTGDGRQTLVPRIFGQTAQAEQRKVAGSRTGIQWNEQSFFEKLGESKNEGATRVARQLWAWASRRMRIDYGNGRQNASMIPFYGNDDVWFGPFRIYTNARGGYVEIPLSGSGMLAPPFGDDAKKLELVRRLNAIPGVGIAEDLGRFPSIDLSTLAAGDRTERFCSVMDWAVDLVHEAGLSPQPSSKR